jgi:hypothetical protein
MSGKDDEGWGKVLRTLMANIKNEVKIEVDDDVAD